jgi:hypothetical protein
LRGLAAPIAGGLERSGLASRCLAAMTRTEFVRDYARQSGLSDRFASLGIIYTDGGALLAMPCGCGDAECQGWLMVSADCALSHLEMGTPEPLRDAYRAAMAAAGGK